MDEKQKIIGLTELLDDVSRDLDEFRKKHPSDYSIRNIAMWWDLEKERLVIRHAPASVVKTLRKVRGVTRTIAWFFVGWLVMLAAQTTLHVWIG